MKVTAPQLFPQLKKGPQLPQSLLFYGPENGLVENKILETLEWLKKAHSLKVSKISVDEVKSNPSKIIPQPDFFREEENFSVFHIGEVKDSFLKIIEPLLKEPSISSRLLILQGVNLRTTSKIVKFCETHPDCFSVGVYEETPAQKKEWVRCLLQEEMPSTQFSPEIMNYLTQKLPDDRLSATQEIRKLALYGADSPAHDTETMEILLSQWGSTPMDAFVRALANRQKDQVILTLRGLWREGMEIIPLLRGVSTYFLKLLKVKASIEGGAPLNTALSQLRPPLFFKTRDLFVQQLSGWSVPQLMNVQGKLQKAELKVKLSPHVGVDFYERVFLSMV